MTVNVQKNDRSYVIKWMVTLIIPLLIFLIPTNSVYTHQMQVFFVITTFPQFVMAFEFFYVIVISVAMPVLWVLFGVKPYRLLCPVGLLQRCMCASVRFFG